MYNFNCFPLLIGSLPVSDHEEATRMIMTHTPEIPLWPQLPVHPREGMVRQFICGYPGLVETDKKFWVDTSGDDFTPHMTTFYEDYLRAEEQQNLTRDSRFCLNHQNAQGFFSLMAALAQTDLTPLSVKGQITGPVTTGIGVKDQNGNSIFYDDNLRDMLIKQLALIARWQAEQLGTCGTRIPPLVFIDEPGIVSFGSTAYAGVTADMVSAAVSEVIAGIKRGGGLAGIHICANGDWAPALLSDADIISFDAYSYFDNLILYREQLIGFLAKGGSLAWGIVPTGNPFIIEQESVELLYARWKAQLKTLSSFGLNQNQLIAQTLITPSCGTGSLSRELALKVMSMTSRLSKKIRRHEGFTV